MRFNFIELSPLKLYLFRNLLGNVLGHSIMKLKKDIENVDREINDIISSKLVK